MRPGAARTRVAGPGDAADVARLLRAFNAEYDDPAPAQDWLADRVRALLGDDTAVVLLEVDGAGAGDAHEPGPPGPPGPHGLALLRLRPSLWEDADEAYLAELYVVPSLRGRGHGRVLLRAAMAHAHERGATYLDLTTTSADEAAVALYESVGFDRHERRGPDVTSYYFEIDLPAP
ncbi:GNAT family N-acetyltransferase [Nocardioides sp. ChNu-153]|uniref:GNAT family N-acetyltransferase n=1 Tax=unclassified Nocardioides TaxID=2615069 RepID=UPI002404BF45|nr:MULTISPECIES: GNAT family N-acetyltransferase [unclassified Nocardioides]MDF9716712.1 GNAT family N-acetyltransferase [Nocardioides sp. ChNu-99]MDN7121139.1 GNAT family N-acetyltransferase [Nocardioides sp. ChNu-153]